MRSNLNKYQVRRFAWLWSPLILTGCALVVGSQWETARINGLTLAGLTIFVAGSAAFIHDITRRDSHG